MQRTISELDDAKLAASELGSFWAEYAGSTAATIVRVQALLYRHARDRQAAIAASASIDTCPTRLRRRCIPIPASEDSTRTPYRLGRNPLGSGVVLGSGVALGDRRDRRLTLRLPDDVESAEVAVDSPFDTEAIWFRGVDFEIRDRELVFLRDIREEGAGEVVWLLGATLRVDPLIDRYGIAFGETTPTQTEADRRRLLDFHAAVAAPSAENYRRAVNASFGVETAYESEPVVASIEDGDLRLVATPTRTYSCRRDPGDRTIRGEAVAGETVWVEPGKEMPSRESVPFLRVPRSCLPAGYEADLLFPNEDCEVVKIPGSQLGFRFPVYGTPRDVERLFDDLAPEFYWMTSRESEWPPRRINPAEWLRGVLSANHTWVVHPFGRRRGSFDAIRLLSPGRRTTIPIAVAVATPASYTVAPIASSDVSFLSAESAYAIAATASSRKTSEMEACS